MIENPDRIKLIIPNIQEKYEAYVYKISIVDTGKSYIGFRSKPYDGTYFYSSECPVFAKDLGKAKKIVYEILEYGSVIDMATREREMLREVNAKNNPLYYNKSNGGGKYAIASFSKAEDLVDSIYNGELNSYIQNVPITILMDLDRIQVRILDDSKHTKQITDRVNDNWGDEDFIRKTFICHVLEDYDGKGSHRLLNGSHTREGIFNSKVGKTAEIPTMIIPKSIWSELDETDLEAVGLMLNPREKNPKKPSEDLSIQKQLLSRYFKKNVPIDSVINKTWLKDRFFMTSNQITSLIKSTTKVLMKQQTSFMGKVWIDWTSNHKKNDLEARLEEHRDKHTFTMGMSSGKFDWNKIIACIIRNHSKKKNFILYIYHPSPDIINYESNWFQKKLPSHLPEFELIFDKLNINWKIEYLPTLASDGSKELDFNEVEEVKT